MPEKYNKGTYKIEAIKYHRALPEGVLPLGISDKNNSPWGYRLKKFENGAICPSENCEQLMRDLVIMQVRANPDRSHVSLELCLENFSYEKEVEEAKRTIEQSSLKFTDQKGNCCGPEMNEHTSKEY